MMERDPGQTQTRPSLLRHAVILAMLGFSLVLSACSAQLNRTPAALKNQVSISGTRVTADGLARSTITIRLVDDRGDALIGATPTFTATDTNGTNIYGPCSPTDDSGISTCTLASFRAENKILAITSPTDFIGDTVIFDPAPVNKIIIRTQPAAANPATGVTVAGTPIGTSPAFELHDIYDNLITTALPITLAPYTDANCTVPGTGILTATTNPVSTSGGIASFSNVTYTKAGIFYIKATSPGLEPACTNALTIVHSTAAKLGFATQPATGAVAGITYTTQPVVEVQDTYGNTVLTGPTAIQPITLSAYSDATCTTTVSGTFSVSANPINSNASGSAAFSGVKHTRATNIYLKATSGSLGIACSNATAVVPHIPNAAQSTITGSGPVAANNYHFSNVTITIKDQYANVRTGDTVTFSATDTGGDNTYGACPVTNGSGYSVCTLKSGTVETKTLQITSPVVKTGGTVQFIIPPDPANSSITATGPAMVSLTPTSTVTITLKDASNNPVVGITPTYNATNTGSTNTYGICSVSNASGISTCSLTSRRAETKTLAIVQPLAMTGGTVIFYNAALSTLTFATRPTTGTAGSAFNPQPVVNLLDQFNNPVLIGGTENTAITLGVYTEGTCTTPGGGTLSASSNPVNGSGGTATFSGTNYTKSGTFYLGASAPGGIKVCTGTTVISPAAASALQFSVQPSTQSLTSTNWQTSPTVRVVDAYGNQVTAGSHSITLSAKSDSACNSAASGSISGAGASPATSSNGLVAFGAIQYPNEETINLKATSGVLSTACSSAVEMTRWKAIPTSGAPSARMGHVAIWTGTQMIIWGGTNGGSYFNDGAKFNPSTNTWTSISVSAQTPTARAGMSAVWTGTEMIVFGGNNGGTYYNNGARYNPGTDTWTPIATPTGIVSTRARHTAVWTGTQMIVYGGYGGSYRGDGGIYTLGSDSWSAMATSGAPSARADHTAVWSGTEMLVFGGYNGTTSFSDGGHFTPGGAGSWSSMQVSGAPQGRNGHSAAWGSTKMYLWGGNTNGTPLDDGNAYTPGAGGSWSTITNAGAPSVRTAHSGTWTSTSRWIIWGGTNGSALDTGAIFNPAGSWTSMSTGTNLPSARSSHSAVWATDRLLIWGGCTSATNGYGGSCSGVTGTGAIYVP